MANRPNFPSGKPLCILFQVFPPSVDLYSALLSPPDSNDQPVLRNSHIEAYKTLGLVGSMAKSAQPVFGSTYKSCSQVAPPSEDLYTPRSSLSPQSAPNTPT